MLRLGNESYILMRLRGRPYWAQIRSTDGRDAGWRGGNNNKVQVKNKHQRGCRYPLLTPPEMRSSERMPQRFHTSWALRFLIRWPRTAGSVVGRRQLLGLGEQARIRGVACLSIQLVWSRAAGMNDVERKREMAVMQEFELMPAR